jgi:hypothetical protein
MMKSSGIATKMEFGVPDPGAAIEMVYIVQLVEEPSLFLHHVGVRHLKFLSSRLKFPQISRPVHIKHTATSMTQSSLPAKALRGPFHLCRNEDFRMQRLQSTDLLLLPISHTESVEAHRVNLHRLFSMVQTDWRRRLRPIAPAASTAGHMVLVTWPRFDIFNLLTFLESQMQPLHYCL